MKKRIITFLLVAVFLLSFIPATAFAGTQTGSPAGTAFIDFTSGDWAATTTGTDFPADWACTDATVTGPGQYTVGLDFTGTANGSIDGTQFFALYLMNGEVDFPGYFLQIDEIRVNGEAIAITGKNYTSSDAPGVDTRSNIWNQWGPATPDALGTDARRADGDLSQSTAMIIDPMVLTGMKTLEVDFTFLDADGNDGSEAAATEETAATDDAAATTDVPKTGVVGLGIVYGLSALATGAFALKRKQR